MKDQLISFETAKLAKEKGFKFKNINLSYSDWYPCFNVTGEIEAMSSNIIKNNEDSIAPVLYFAPTQSLLQKWLREKHNIHCIFDVYITDNTYCYKIVYTVNNAKCELQSSYLPYLDYESALEHALKQGLKLIK